MRCICCNSKYECGCQNYDQTVVDLKNAEDEIKRLQQEVSKRNQYKINEESLKNVHEHYESLERDVKYKDLLLEEISSLLVRISSESVPLFSSNRLQNIHKECGALLEKLNRRKL